MCIDIEEGLYRYISNTSTDEACHKTQYIKYWFKKSVYIGSKNDGLYIVPVIVYIL